MTDTPNLGLTPLAPAESMRNASLPKINAMMDKVDAAFTSRDRAFFGRARDGGEGKLRQMPVREARELLGLASHVIPNRKLIPTLICSEAGAYGSPVIQRWEDTGGAALMTKAFYQERFDDWADLGMEEYVEMYPAGWGRWYFRPSFAGTLGYPVGYETGSAVVGQFYHDVLSAPHDSNYEDFDFLEARLERADARGVAYWMGLPRAFGDIYLTNDLFNVNHGGQADPMRFGMTLSARLAAAIEETQRLAKELYDRYKHHPSLAGFKFSEETVHFPSSNAFYTACMTGGSGAYPRLDTYQAPTAEHPDGLKIMITPTRLIETWSGPFIDITSDAYAQAVVDSGVDVVLMQNNSGDGYNYVERDSTWLRTTEYSYSVADNWQRYSERVRKMIANANSYARLKRRRIELKGMLELWCMGNVPSATLTMGANYNVQGSTGVTFAATGAFTGIVNGAVVTDVSGKATVTDASGAPDSVVVSIVRAFAGGNTRSSQFWAWINAYGNPYPMTATEYERELPHILANYEQSGLYAENFFGNPAAELRPPATWNGRSDYRTRSEGLYARIRDSAREQLGRFRAWSPKIMVAEEEYRAGPFTAGPSISQLIGTYRPLLHGSHCRIRAWVEFSKAPNPDQVGADGDAVISLLIGATVIAAVTIRDKVGWMGGVVPLIPRDYAPTGNPFDLTVTGTAVDAAAGDLTIHEVVIEVQEYIRP